MEKNYILTADVAGKKLRRMAYEILENNPGENHIILAGIRENGYVVAAGIARLLGEISGVSTELIGLTLDKKHPSEVVFDHVVDLRDKTVIIIDDVTNSGKTLLYATRPFLEQHPKTIQMLVMVERTHKKFPVHPDYVGLSLATTLHEHIFVEVEGDRVTGAYLA